jgi:tryptophan synthase alpha chain
MNRINKLFQVKEREICSVFVTAGYPKRDSLLKVVPALEVSGVDLIEIGIPFSDPLADGPVIQESSKRALENGMNVHLLIDQVRNLRKQTHIPIILMGYFNPIHRYGLEKFLSDCEDIGIDGLIIPDLSIDLYCSHYEKTCERYDVPLIFLASSDSTEERLRLIDAKSRAFIYLLSSSATTGKRSEFSSAQKLVFDRLLCFELNSPILLGFGIHDAETFSIACSYFNGGVIGSAFIRHLRDGRKVVDFISTLQQRGHHLDSPPS